MHAEKYSHIAHVYNYNLHISVVDANLSAGNRNTGSLGRNKEDRLVVLYMLSLIDNKPCSVFEAVIIIKELMLALYSSINIPLMHASIALQTKLTRSYRTLNRN